jgi:hypothetical protein
MNSGTGRNEKTLRVHFKPSWREKPRKVILHVPPIPGLKEINVNGTAYPAAERIEL